MVVPREKSDLVDGLDDVFEGFDVFDVLDLEEVYFSSLIFPQFSF